MAEGRPYCALGDKIDAVARKRHVRGPHRIAKYVWSRNNGEGPSGVAWSKILYGDSHPQAKTMVQFANAFELSEEERDELARLCTFPPELVGELG